LLWSLVGLRLHAGQASGDFKRQHLNAAVKISVEEGHQAQAVAQRGGHRGDSFRGMGIQRNPVAAPLVGLSCLVLNTFVSTHRLHLSAASDGAF
jgi:hypothetical protein